ncbi:MAG: hypothetical protein V8S30_03025 [Merdibacter sp.]
MEKLSRVEKYKDLRDSIDQQSSPAGKPSIEPVELQKRLQQLKQKGLHEAVTEENENKHSRIPPRISKEIDVNRSCDSGRETFHNEYLDDFLNEVKEYNLEKGNRLSDNTQIDILMQLNPEHRRERTQYYDEISKDDFEVKEREDDEDVSYTQSLSNEELQAEVDRLFLDADGEPEPETKPACEEVIETAPPLIRINPVTPPLKKEESQPVDEENSETELSDEDTPTDEIEKTRIIENPCADIENDSTQIESFSEEDKETEETAQIQMPKDIQKIEAKEHAAKTSKSNKMLNAILLILILALIGVIAVTVYWLKEAGGIF